MSTKESDLKVFLKKLNGQYAVLNSEIQAINDKIDAINRALKKAQYGLDLATKVKATVQRIDPGGSWKGKRRIGFDKGKNTTVPQSTQRYINDIKQMMQQMRDERKKLITERDRKIASLFSIQANMKRVERSLQKVLAEKDI